MMGGGLEGGDDNVSKGEEMSLHCPTPYPDTARI
eukprot:CAMPEP_0204076096 /NCGR_PEP_ID=MMETSP0360-20130528/167346_1 /ASSEMBLY_ACC=CAM_ASM_000342 /TAXON_ID=268821 /ORGANISM="Scrippsiella Hangoei, Strain SHTV-5" /LENGTH=33 /DNA_ID= /DNA_START= /DNA_END= /DNA_ORIENTATION=